MRKPKDWGQPCPDPECPHYRRMQQGNVSAIATYLTQSGKRRLFCCHVCDALFGDTQDSLFRSPHLGREGHDGSHEAPGPS